MASGEKQVKSNMDYDYDYGDFTGSKIHHNQRSIDRINLMYQSPSGSGSKYHQSNAPFLPGDYSNQRSHYHAVRNSRSPPQKDFNEFNVRFRKDTRDNYNNLVIRPIRGGFDSKVSPHQQQMSAVKKLNLN